MYLIYKIILMIPLQPALQLYKMTISQGVYSLGVEESCSVSLDVDGS